MRRLAAAFGATLLIALAVTPLPSFYLRFILFFPAILAIAAVRLVERLPRLAPILGLCVAWSVVSTLVPGDLRLSDIARLRRQPVSARVPDPRFDLVPPGDTVACLYGTHNDSNGESYVAYGPGFSRKVHYITRASGVEDLLSQLRNAGATWIFAQARNGDGELRLQVLEAARRGLLRKESNNLYRVSRSP